MEEEIWKAIVIEKNGIIYDYTGLYEVSNLGRVRSLNYRRTGKIKVLRPRNNGNNYLKIYLSKDRERETFYIHRIVAKVFLLNDNPTEKIEVNHKDFDRTNNRVDNLEWVTIQENMQHLMNTDKEREAKRRQKIKDTRNNKKKVLCVETGRLFDSIAEASESYHCQKTGISACCNGRGKKTCGGYHWKFVSLKFVKKHLLEQLKKELTLEEQ